MTTPAAPRKRVLLTGVSGTGKSSAIARLAELGNVAIDADAPGYSAEVPAPEDELTGIGPGRDWVWQEDAIRAILDRPDPVIFLSGCSPNQGAFYPALTHVILLTASPALIAERLTTRTNNPFGKDPGELARALARIIHERDNGASIGYSEGAESPEARRCPACHSLAQTRSGSSRPLRSRSRSISWAAA